MSDKAFDFWIDLRYWALPIAVRIERSYFSVSLLCFSGFVDFQRLKEHKEKRAR